MTRLRDVRTQIERAPRHGQLSRLTDARRTCARKGVREGVRCEYVGTRAGNGAVSVQEPRTGQRSTLFHISSRGACATSRAALSPWKSLRCFFFFSGGPTPLSGYPRGLAQVRVRPLRPPSLVEPPVAFTRHRTCELQTRTVRVLR